MDKDKDWTWGGWGTWGGVGLGSWGSAFSFLCFGIVECAHGHAYAKQARIMCVLSVPLLDQVWGGNRANFHPGACGMTESTLRSFSSSGRGVVVIPLGDKRKFVEGGVWGGNRAKDDPGGAEFRGFQGIRDKL